MMEHKSAVLVLLICISVVQIVKGSCLEYGHSCWGAHGKRSGKAVASVDHNSSGSDSDASAMNSKQKIKPHRYVLLSILLDKKLMNDDIDKLEYQSNLEDIYKNKYHRAPHRLRAMPADVVGNQNKNYLVRTVMHVDGTNDAKKDQSEDFKSNEDSPLIYGGSEDGYDDDSK